MSLERSIWRPDSDPFFEPLTDAAFRRAEAVLGVTLPLAYRALLEVRNGGYLDDAHAAFATDQPTSWAPDHVPFEQCFGIGDGHYSIMESPYLNREWGQPEKLVLLCGDGHWWIALDYRRSETPSVVWYDNEVGEDIQLASSFDDFIADLGPAPKLDS